ncbi:gamma subclass chorismate mutase AroQ [Rhodococcus sp. IEGM 1354]|uniref:gamma subclass chorismate mutase AroQ n=1 Tax=Rhodococcus sp. IEGM 1354 TaxID=3047088 RepID=UPI0024B6C416|nr:gamma subclass chorismate mutase AroQ [Rhodococcus sp. IEGM 1354]MDI9929296.1 gamma subclass chorismate mutase AroQ [Rhodococcus sp. IEGM 1354]
MTLDSAMAVPLLFTVVGHYRRRTVERKVREMSTEVSLPANASRLRRIARIAVIAAVVPLVLLPTAATSAAETPAENLQSLTDVLADRLATADSVAAVKWKTGGPVSDPEREAQVIDAAQNAAIGLGLAPERAGTVVRDQIEVGKAIQSLRLAQWHADPADAPDAPADLAPIRERITALTSAVVTQLASNAQALRSPTCYTDLVQAVVATNTAHDSDIVHAAALVAASRSLCTT